MRPESRQEIAKRLVAEADWLVDRQRQLVAALEKNGANIMVARELLIQFEMAAVTFRRTLDLLLGPDGNSSSMTGGLSGNVQIGDSDRQMLQYLRQALEADVLASALTDQTLKEQWREIACGYRNLAQARLTNAETLEQPSRYSGATLLNSNAGTRDRTLARQNPGPEPAGSAGQPKLL